MRADDHTVDHTVRSTDMLPSHRWRQNNGETAHMITHNPNDIVTRLSCSFPKNYAVGCGRCLFCLAKDEINHLRDLVHRWKNAAEAYERGSLGTGDRLIDEARKAANRG